MFNIEYIGFKNKKLRGKIYVSMDFKEGKKR